MTLLEIIFIALGLAMDAFAVALAVGGGQFSNGIRPVFRISFHFGLFQFLMPVIGWYLGTTINKYIYSWDHWLAFGLLAYVGGRMIHASFDKDTETHTNDPTRKWTLMILCIATSLDALAIGLSLAMLRISIWYPSVVIGVVTALLSALGMYLGKTMGQSLGKRMELIGGVILCGIGIKVLFSHF